MSPDLLHMLQGMIHEANSTRDSENALGSSFVSLLPFKTGDLIPYNSNAQMRVHRITFELHCYMRSGAWQPGYAVTGIQMISAGTPGSTNVRALFNLDGSRAVLGA